MTKTTVPENRVPASVVATLNTEELVELESALALASSLDTLGYAKFDLAPTNRGIRYMLMYSPIKYSVVMLPQVSDAELRDLLIYDQTRPDARRELFGSAGSEAEDAWEQRVATSMAALGNPNIIAGTAAWLLDELIATEPTDFPPAEIASSIGYQLTDKWDPKNFNAAALGELVRVFETYEANEYLAQFRRWARRAAKSS
jgi:hypothetical protein